MMTDEKLQWLLRDAAPGTGRAAADARVRRPSQAWQRIRAQIDTSPRPSKTARWFMLPTFATAGAAALFVLIQPWSERNNSPLGGSGLMNEAKVAMTPFKTSEPAKTEGATSAVATAPARRLIDTPPQRASTHPSTTQRGGPSPLTPHFSPVANHHSPLTFHTVSYHSGYLQEVTEENGQTIITRVARPFPRYAVVYVAPRAEVLPRAASLLEDATVIRSGDTFAQRTVVSADERAAPPLQEG